MRVLTSFVLGTALVACQGETKDLFFRDTNDSEDSPSETDDTTLDTELVDTVDSDDTVVDTPDDTADTNDSDTVDTTDSDDDSDDTVDTVDDSDPPIETASGDSAADSDVETGDTGTWTPPPRDSFDTFDTSVVFHPFCTFNTTLTLWDVPGGLYAGDGSFDTMEEPCDGSNEPGHFQLDLDGDGREDLVVSDGCNDSGVGDIGELHWEVFFNSGSGHPGPASNWALPGAAFPGNETFDARTKDSVCVGSEQPAYEVFDIDNDGQPELVITESCSDADVGSDYWLVFDNTGNGFSNTASTWEVPGATYDGSLTSTGAAADCASGEPGFGMADMDGDGRPDLVITQDCTDTAVGEDHWPWFKNLGAAFAASPGRFGLPGSAYLGDGNFLGLSGAVLCNGLVESPSFSLLDLDGDGRLDLVATDECDVGGNGLVGEVHWNVFFHAGTGFASTPFEWSLPGATYVGEETFELTNQAQDCSGTNEKPLYATVDLDRSGRPDLIILDECDSGGGGDVGERYWPVYVNSGSGFRSSPSNWLLPGTSFAGNESIDTLGEPAACSTGVDSPAYDVRDLNGDGQMELVVTDRCTDTTTGETEWVVYFAPDDCRP